MRWYRYFILLVLSGVLFILPQKVSAQDLELKTCASATNWNNNVSDCYAHLNTHTIPCLQGGYQGKKLPESTWGPGAFGSNDDEKCVDTNNDGKLDTAELTTCKKNFSTYMCRNMPWTGYFGGTCVGACLDNIPEDVSGKRMWEVLGAEFERQYNVVNAITPTPTPTLAPTPPVGTVDDPFNCIARFGSAAVTNLCTDGLNILSGCLSLDDPDKINRAHTFWQDAMVDYFSAKNRIETAANGNSDINSAGRCIEKPEYSDAFISKLQNTISYLQGNEATNPDPTEEDGGWLLAESTIDMPVFGVDCGIPDAVDSVKRQCCVAVKGEVNLDVPYYLKPIEGTMEAVSNGAISVFRTAAKGIHTVMNAMILDSDPTHNAYCMKGEPSSNKISKSPYDDPSCVCELPDTTAINTDICKILPVGEQTECARCLQGISIVDGKEVAGNAGIWTGVGCVQTNLASFIEKNVFGPLLGFAGMVALGCIIYSAFVMQTSQGNPEQVQKAQELITSCIMGLILIILSVFILRVIGVDILRIPGFSE